MIKVIDDKNDNYYLFSWQGICNFEEYFLISFYDNVVIKLDMDDVSTNKSVEVVRLITDITFEDII